MVYNGCTWCQVNAPGFPNIAPLNIPAGRPSVIVTPVLDNILELFFKFMPQDEFDKMAIFTNRKVSEYHECISAYNCGSS